MKEYTLSKIFLDVYNDRKVRFVGKKTLKIKVDDYEALEQTLADYLITILGYRLDNNYQDHFGEIRKYFENIINNMADSDYSNILETIKRYGCEFNEILNNHHYTQVFINAVRRMYCKNYDGKSRPNDANHYWVLENQSNYVDDFDTIISHLDHSLIVSKLPKKGEDTLPFIFIDNIDSFENTLANYVSCVEQSDSFYNIFSKYSLPKDEMVQMLFECTLFNATSSDLLHTEHFFNKYIYFVLDNSFRNIRKPYYMGDAFNDELYVMSKKAEIEYETPYYLSFMLKNSRIELPNIRLGIFEEGGRKVAHILATQTAQTILNESGYKELQNEIKKNIPASSYFRFFNPTHLVSLLITFGVLNGMGIQDIEVADLLPFRYNKTVLDKNMNEEEADRYQMRLTNKNMITYMKLISMTNGIEIISYPEMNVPLKLRLNHLVSCESEMLQNLYNLGYQAGRSACESSEFNYDARKRQ